MGTWRFMILFYFRIFGIFYIRIFINSVRRRSFSFPICSPAWVVILCPMFLPWDSSCNAPRDLSKSQTVLLHQHHISVPFKTKKKYVHDLYVKLLFFPTEVQWLILPQWWKDQTAVGAQRKEATRMMKMERLPQCERVHCEVWAALNKYPTLTGPQKSFSFIS